MSPARSYIGGLYEFQITSERRVYGLCTHQIMPGWWAQLGPLVRFFDGVETARVSDLDSILVRPVLFNAFAQLSRMTRAKTAIKLAQVDIPEALVAAPRLRQGGPPIDPEFFLVEGLETGGPLVPVDDPVSDAELARTSHETLMSLEGIRDVYRLGLTPERKYLLAYELDTLDEAKDEAFPL